MNRHRYDVTVSDTSVTLECPASLFSPRGLDAGTRAMLQVVDIADGCKVLDLGCGSGVVGILLAKRLGTENVFLTDVDAVAVDTAARNAALNKLPHLSVTQSDGFRDFRESGFDHILSNPPYHTDFAVAKHFIMKGFNRLVIGGQMHFVVKRPQWYRNKLRSVFGGCQVREINGYSVLSATRRRESYASRR
ncbi:MAG: class I SAM-dependent methyltransferase [Planctomycetaceae bacterium]|nr:class I SAM-dependent methyltransferase [Planctomycetaceae bacterium]